MEIPAVGWGVLVVAACLLGGGLGLLATSPQVQCGPDRPACTAPLRSGLNDAVGWSAIGLSLLLEVLWFSLTHGATELGHASHHPNHHPHHGPHHGPQQHR
jgi:hypothetical protein